MRHRAFPGRGPDIAARYERAGQWLLATVLDNQTAKEWCAKNGVTIHKAADEGIDTAGGFLVPGELSTAIADLRDLYGAFRRRARIVPMKHDSMHVPRRAGAQGPTGASGAFFMGGNTAATATSFNVDTIGLTAKKIGSIVLLSSELEDDAISSMVDYIANEIAWAFAVKEDDCAFNGDGTSTYGGMRGIRSIVLDGNHATAKVVAASAHNTFLTLDATDIANLMTQVRASAIPNAAWFVSQTGFAQTFCRLSAGSGYLYSADVDGIMTPFYMGFPVIFSQKLPLVSTTLTGQGMMAFGDMYAGGILGERRGITIKRSPERYLDSDQIAILGTQRFHAIPHDLGDATNAGSIAVLVAP